MPLAIVRPRPPALYGFLPHMRFILVALCLVVPSLALAADESHQIWSSITVHKKLTDAWSFYFDGNLRLYDDHDGSQILLRPGVMRRLTEDLSVYLAYAWTPSWDDATGDMTDEHRIWQQLAWNIGGIGAFSFYSRSRLEERFRPATSDDLGVRFRELLRVIWKANDLFGISVWDEFFIDLNAADDENGERWQRFGLDQNRLFIGPTAYFPCNVRLEIGYLNQYIDVSVPNEMRHVAALNGFVDF